MNEENKEEENNNEANASWWGSWPSWLQTAKEKSSTALEFMKRDLTEFGQVVQTDAVAAVSSTAAILKEKLTVDTAEAVADKARQSLSSVIGTLADVFAPQKELEEGELMIIKDSEPVLMDWWQTQLFRIRTDPKTFCHEPEGPPEMYENWLESFEPSEYQEEMTEIIMSCSETRALYDKLVPTSVSHLEFWQRYFYRVYLLRKAEAKRADLMRKAEQISIDDIEWDRDEEITTELRHSYEKKEYSDHSKTTQEKADSTLSSKRQLQSISDSDTVFASTLFETELSDTKTLDIIEDVNYSDIKDQNLENSTLDLTHDTKNTNLGSSSNESTHGSRSSPIESIGKDSSTGDEWEKDFDLEINEDDLKKIEHSNKDIKKEDEEWEQWK